MTTSKPPKAQGFTRADEVALRAYLTAGESSPQGKLIDRVKNGLAYERGTRVHEPTDAALEAARFNRLVGQVLTQIGAIHTRVLSLRYGRFGSIEEGVQPGLESWGTLGGVVLYVLEHTSDHLVGKDGQPIPDLGPPTATELDAEKRELNAATGTTRAYLRERAENMLTDAQAAYAHARTAVAVDETIEKADRRASRKRAVDPMYTAEVTIRTAARYLKVAESTIGAMLADGRLAFRMVGAHNQHRRVVLTSSAPFPADFGLETRGRKKKVDRPNTKK